MQGVAPEVDVQCEFLFRCTSISRTGSGKGSLQILNQMFLENFQTGLDLVRFPNVVIWRF